MSQLKYALENGLFAITAEMAPPKGYDFSEAVEVAGLLKDKVHGINVTDMQSACLKASSLGLCIRLKQAGVEPILQITGRDRNRMAIMADVLSAASFGSITNTLSTPQTSSSAARSSTHVLVFTADHLIFTA